MTPYSVSIVKALRNLGWHSMADHVAGMQAMIDAAPAIGDRVRVECPRCDASGQISADGRADQCPYCSGSGVVRARMVEPETHLDRWEWDNPDDTYIVATGEAP